jgi:hypothetical protein
MVPVRRPRNSLPTSPNPGDEFSNLTLAEVRDRLTRNARVLSSTLLTPSTSPSSASILNQHMSGAGPSRPRPTHDPVRAKLEAVREALLAREAELLAGEMGGLEVKDEPMEMEMKVEPGSSPIGPTNGMGRRGSGTPGGSRSGKQRALDLIRQGESGLAPGAILL